MRTGFLVFLWWIEFREFYLSLDSSVSVDCISHVAPARFPLLPLYPGPPDCPVNAAVEADDDRQGKKPKENQPTVKQSCWQFFNKNHKNRESN